MGDMDECEIVYSPPIKCNACNKFIGSCECAAEKHWDAELIDGA